MVQVGEEVRTRGIGAKRPPSGFVGARVFLCVSRGLPVYPGVHVAFSPSQVLSYPVGLHSPFPPFGADGAFGDCENHGYVACGEHAAGAAC